MGAGEHREQAREIARYQEELHTTRDRATITSDSILQFSSLNMSFQPLWIEGKEWCQGWMENKQER